jgi:hypothetical protein
LTHLYRTWDANALYNFGIRKFNIIHCQLRNEVSNPTAHLSNDFLSNNTDCPNKSILMLTLLFFGVDIYIYIYMYVSVWNLIRPILCIILRTDKQKMVVIF